MARIEFDHVTKTIKQHTVVDDISFSIEPGMVTGLKGVNGSGKTMLMRLISGLIYPSSGKVIIDGKIRGKDLSFPESIGVLIENPAFLDSYSGLDNLQMLAKVKGLIDEGDIIEIMKLVDIYSAGKKKYKKYSLGMKQRLGIAAAVMENPDIVVLDEPTNALDESGVEMVKHIISLQRKRGAAVIISCHDGQILDELADVVYCIENGRITQSYAPQNTVDGDI